MKKILLCILFCALCAGASPAISSISPTYGVPAGSDTSYTIVKGQIGKAAELKTGAADGYLCVHLVGDAKNVRYNMPLTALNGYRNAALFDKIFFHGTSVVLDSVIIFITTN